MAQNVPESQLDLSCDMPQCTEPVSPQTCLKQDSSHQSLQIDCRANHTQPDIYHTFPADAAYSNPELPGTVETGRMQDRDSKDDRGAERQDPTSSHESSRPSQCLSPGIAQTHDKKCSQCGATKTPMWRNDTNGNKTLCNACGVRLQRQINKQKQQSQAMAENPTSLIAGKLPRSRTSPAKLSRQDMPRTGSQEALRVSETVGNRGTISRSLTLVQNSNGQPTLTIAQGPPKRKGMHGALTFETATEAERKRLCNDASGPASSGPTLDAGLPTELLIPNGRAPNCTVRLEMAGGLNTQGPPGGRLRVYTATGKLAASSSLPGNEEALRYSLDHQAWIWSASPKWSLLFASKETSSSFEDILRRWRASRQADLDLGRSQTLNPSPHQRLEGINIPNPGFVLPPPEGIEVDDRKFLDHINAKIMKEANGSYNATNPKELTALLAEDTFQRLISTFEYFLQRTQGFSEANVCQLSVNLDWTPNRAVILAVHRYWVSKLHRTRRWADFGKASSGGGPQPASIPRSFSASPPVVSSRSDMSAMTLEEFALAQGGGSEETSDNTQHQSAFSVEGANFAGGLLDFGQKDSAFPMPQGLGSNANLGLGFMQQPWLTNTCFNPLSGPALSQAHPEEWDPLDPSNLARIADPHQTNSFETQKSTTLAGLDDKASLQNRCSLPILGSSGSEVGPRGGLPALSLEPMGSDFAQAQPPPAMDAQMVGFQESAHPNSPGNNPLSLGLRATHSGVDLSSLRRQLYSSSFSSIEDLRIPSLQARQGAELKDRRKGLNGNSSPATRQDHSE